MSKELKCPRYSSHCSFYCKKCYQRPVIDYCPYFLPYKCDKTDKLPYVCNYCGDYRSCPLDKRIYDAAFAQRQYEKKLYNFRKGINMTPEELPELNDLISPLILSKKKSEPKKSKNLQQVYRNKRTYVDFKCFMEAHPDLDVVEMDTVKGGRDKGKCLLTLLFKSCSCITYPHLIRNLLKYS